MVYACGLRKRSMYSCSGCGQWHTNCSQFCALLRLPCCWHNYRVKTPSWYNVNTIVVACRRRDATRRKSESAWNAVFRRLHLYSALIHSLSQTFTEKYLCSYMHSPRWFVNFTQLHNSCSRAFFVSSIAYYNIKLVCISAYRSVTNTSTRLNN